VTLNATGVPAGATATFSPNPATGASSTLTVATSGTTPVNTFTITVTGTSGTLSHTTTVSLTVTAAPCTGRVRQLAGSCRNSESAPTLSGRFLLIA